MKNRHVRISWKEKLHKVWFLLGLACVAAMLVPYLILGQEAIVTYHDQLDGEMIAYILQAKHLFSGDILPEFMNGADKTALTMPAPGFVLLFLSGNYFAALVAMQLLGSLCGYLGMYLLAWEITGEKPAAAAAGVLYAYLPFLPVYGLSQYGIPLLVWCFLQLKKNRRVKGCFAYCIIYALCSSLVLSGFGVLGAGFAWTCLLWWKNRDKKQDSTPSGEKAILKKGALLSGSAVACMLTVYLAENFRLLKQVLFGTGQAVSHKAEYVLAPEPFLKGLLQGFLQGGQHSEDYHKWILAGALAVALTALLLGAWKRAEEKKLLTVMGFCAGINFVFALVAAFWNSSAGIALRTGMQAVGAFQVQRLLWLAPCFWYLLLACTAALAWRLLLREKGEPGEGKAFGGRIRGAGLVCCIVAAAVAAVTGIQVLLSSNLKPNIQKLRDPDYGLLSYGDYYAAGVMEQVRAFLRETTGQEPEEYRVVSLGIDPAAALYHGFYCLDGYSNNYSLEYKHRFRRIIAPELAKSEYLTDYFDDWGNRCYLVSGECPGYYTIEKNGFHFRDYSIDGLALKELGGKYLFSAAYIMNAEEQGLTLLREEPFETEESYYRIFVYGIL